MTPYEQSKAIEELKDKIELAIIVFCLVIISVCCVAAYIILPIQDKMKETTPSSKVVKYVAFSMPIGDTTGTEAYEERTVSDYTDEWGVRTVDKERIK